MVRYCYGCKKRFTDERKFVKHCMDVHPNDPLPTDPDKRK